MVWLYNANIGYLSCKHIPLFLVAVLIFLFLFLPYTFLFLFGQWLQGISVVTVLLSYVEKVFYSRHEPVQYTTKMKTLINIQKHAVRMTFTTHAQTGLAAGAAHDTHEQQKDD